MQKSTQKKYISIEENKQTGGTTFIDKMKSSFALKWDRLTSPYHKVATLLKIFLVGEKVPGAKIVDMFYNLDVAPDFHPF